MKVNYKVFILFSLGFVINTLAQGPPPPPPGLPIDFGVGCLIVAAIGIGVKELKK